MKPKRKFAVVTGPTLSRTPQTREEKLAAAIAYLGPRWVLHPDCKGRPEGGVLQQWRIGRYNV